MAYDDDFRSLFQLNDEAILNVQKAFIHTHELLGSDPEADQETLAKIANAAEDGKIALDNLEVLADRIGFLIDEEYAE